MIDGAALDLAQLALDAVELVAVVHRHAGGQRRRRAYFSGSSVTIDELRHAFGDQARS